MPAHGSLIRAPESRLRATGRSLLRGKHRVDAALLLPHDRLRLTVHAGLAELRHQVAARSSAFFCWMSSQIPASGRLRLAASARGPSTRA